MTDEAAEGVLELVRRILNFDPTASSFTESRAASMRAWRARKVAEAQARGVPAYELTGGKGVYERAKLKKASGGVNAP